MFIGFGRLICDISAIHRTDERIPVNICLCKTRAVFRQRCPPVQNLQLRRMVNAPVFNTQPALSTICAPVFDSFPVVIDSLSTGFPTPACDIRGPAAIRISQLLGYPAKSSRNNPNSARTLAHSGVFRRTDIRPV
jgi:hypothetical protein